MLNPQAVLANQSRRGNNRYTRINNITNTSNSILLKDNDDDNDDNNDNNNDNNNNNNNSNKYEKEHKLKIQMLSGS